MTKARKKARSLTTTSGWSSEFREQILASLNETGNPIAVAVRFQVKVEQVMRCVARERHRERQGPEIKDLSQFYTEIEHRARLCLMYALADPDVDSLKRGELARKVLEGRGILRAVDVPPSAQVNVFQGPTQIQNNQLHAQLVHMSDDNINARILEIVGQAGATTAHGADGDACGEGISGEPAVDVGADVPGQGATEEGTLPEAPRALPGGPASP